MRKIFDSTKAYGLLEKIFRQFKKPHAIILSLILLYGAFIHLWGINHLFKWIADYDEGAYSLGGLFISRGYVPYRDFVLVHPPLYDLSLGLIYKIFGYNFFYGRFFSIILSLVSMILIYMILKRLFNSSSGLVGAALFSVFPGLYYSWYRVVQEPLGIFFILMAVFMATEFIVFRKTSYRLLITGLFLGLSIATKYTFIAPAIGITLALILLSVEPFFSRPISWKNILLKLEPWLLTAGIITGYLLISGYFLITSPHEYINQTIIAQAGYRLNGTLHTVLEKFQRFTYATTEDKIITVCIVSIIFILIIMLIRKDFSRCNKFLFITLIISALVSSSFNRFGETRYFVPTFTIFILGTASLIPELNSTNIKYRINWHVIKLYSNLFLVNILLLASMIGFLIQRHDYYFMGPVKLTYEETVYQQTIAFLKNNSGKKVYALNPVIPALVPELESSLYFDTFGLLEVIKLSGKEVIQKQIASNVDYIIVDINPRLMAFQKLNYQDLIREILINFPMIKTFTPGILHIFDVDIFLVQ